MNPYIQVIITSDLEKCQCSINYRYCTRQINSFSELLYVDIYISERFTLI